VPDYSELTAAPSRPAFITDTAERLDFVVVSKIELSEQLTVHYSAEPDGCFWYD